MATTDTFPIDPDYTVTRTKEATVLRGRVESAREFFRQKAAPRLRPRLQPAFQERLGGH